MAELCRLNVLGRLVFFAEKLLRALIIFAKDAGLAYAFIVELKC